MYETLKQQKKKKKVERGASMGGGESTSVGFNLRDNMEKVKSESADHT